MFTDTLMTQKYLSTETRLTRTLLQGPGTACYTVIGRQDHLTGSLTSFMAAYRSIRPPLFIYPKVDPVLTH